jgi:3,4-dihydroxy 2-butanone 4-phosphate synthase/GTP cyclohydrolase II
MVPGSVEERDDIVATDRADLPTRYGDFDVVAFRGEEGRDHLAVLKGEVEGQEDVLVRIHSRCVTGEVLHSRRCDCGAQLEHALRRIDDEGQGVLVYLAQEGRGIGLLNKIQAYNLQDDGADTVEANRQLGLPDDARDYQPAAHLLDGLEVESVRVLTNNPDKVQRLEEAGVTVTERVPIVVGRNQDNIAYLETKAKEMGHLLDDLGPSPSRPWPP